jgi:hypothetical protein
VDRVFFFVKEDLSEQTLLNAGYNRSTLSVVTAKSDLETRQVDAVNAFVHCDLDETVFIIRLCKAIYRLRRSQLSGRIFIASVLNQ